MASSAGQRKTNPPKRLIGQVLQGAPTIMPTQETNNSLSEPGKEVTLTDLMAMMKQSQEKTRISQKNTL